MCLWECKNTQWFILSGIINFLCTCICLHVYTCSTCVQVPEEVRGGFNSLGTWVTDSWELSDILENKQGSTTRAESTLNDLSSLHSVVPVVSYQIGRCPYSLTQPFHSCVCLSLTCPQYFLHGQIWCLMTWQLIASVPFWTCHSFI